MVGLVTCRSWCRSVAVGSRGRLCRSAVSCVALPTGVEPMVQDVCHGEVACSAGYDRAEGVAVGDDGGRDLIRVSDADRAAVADRLRTAVDEGRLTVAEYDDRLRLAYAAVTYGDLAPLTRDLPASPAAAVPGPGSTSAAAARPESWWAPWGKWLSGNVFFLVIWGWSSIAAGHLTFFWPGFILLLTVMGPVRRALKGDSNG